MTQSRTVFDQQPCAPVATIACMDEVVRIRVHSASHATAVILLSSMVAMAGIVSLYVIKSAAGINLMQGPSMFHALFY
jgi:hypothetical protein